MSQAIYDNFIKDDRWRYITDGLQVTLEVTFFLYSLELSSVFW